ncbi:MAG: hypothetical protein IH874_07275, partial [Candidatus Dadabacteria bacterium]|nr:hypothetical protein [Candidatus Dadabacteria bacterium]
DAAQVRAYVTNSTITAAGDVLLTATATETITSRILSGSVAIAAGGLQPLPDRRELRSRKASLRTIA